MSPRHQAPSPRVRHCVIFCRGEERVIYYFGRGLGEPAIWQLLRQVKQGTVPLDLTRAMVVAECIRRVNYAPVPSMQTIFDRSDEDPTAEYDIV